jgi:zinc transporter
VDSWHPDDGILWIDFDQANRRAAEWLDERSGVSASVYNILLAGETRPRAFAEGEGLLVVLRGINMNPGAEPDDMVAVRMWLEAGRIITSRRRKVLSVLDLRDALREGRGPESAGQFLVALTGCLAGRIESAVENIESQLEGLGDQVAGGDFETVRAGLGILRRQAAAIRRHLAPQRDALDRIARMSAGVLTDSDVFDLREEGDHLTRHIEDLDLSREQALVTQEELMNRIATEQNARMYLLSVVAAIFLPLTFVTGLLGMNVAGLPGTVNPNGFIVSAVIMVVLGIGLVVYFKFRRWI